MAHCYLHSSYQLTSINALIASFKYRFWNCYQNRLKLENFYHINCHDLLLQIQRILKDEYLSVNIKSQFSTKKYIFFGNWKDYSGVSKAILEGILSFIGLLIGLEGEFVSATFSITFGGFVVGIFGGSEFN